MKPVLSIAVQLALMLFLGCVAQPALADDAMPNRFALTVKTGFMRMADDRQTINNHEWDFRNVHSLFALEGEGWISPQKNLTVGGEYVRYSTSFTRVDNSSFSHKLSYGALQIKSKYYFGSANDVWRPYLGGGIGVSHVTDGNGPIGGDAGGLVLQGVAGMQWRSERIGVRTEYVYLHASVDDENTDKVVNAGGHLLFMGVTFYFGSAR